MKVLEKYWWAILLGILAIFAYWWFVMKEKEPKVAENGCTTTLPVWNQKLAAIKAEVKASPNWFASVLSRKKTGETDDQAVAREAKYHLVNTVGVCNPNE